MLLIFSIPYYTVVPVSCCINNNLRILVAITSKLAHWLCVTLQVCGQLGQVSSAVFGLRPTLCRESCPHGSGMRFVFTNIMSKISI